MSRTTKSERRRAKQQMLTWKRGQRYLREILNLSKAVKLPGVPHQAGVGEWARHLRRCDQLGSIESHAAYVRLQVPISARALDTQDTDE